MKGRKPIAIEVQEARGAYRKDPQRRPSNVIKADEATPEPPAPVKADKRALAVWDETCMILANTGILSRTDQHLLTRYVLVYAEWLKCAEHIQKHGHADENGKTSPESVAFFKLAADHAKLLPELGLSPSSRARLSHATSQPNDAKENQDITAFIRAMKDA